jgi:hypothetical protein
MKPTSCVAIRACSAVAPHTGAVIIGLAVVSIMFLPTFAWGQWSGTNPVWTSSNVGIGTASPRTNLDVNGAIYAGSILVAYHSNLGGTNGFSLGAPPKASTYGGGQGSILIGSNDPGTPLQAWISLVGDPNGANRRLSLGAVEQGIAFRNITMAEYGGNVGIGTTNPQYLLSVNGAIGAKDVVVTNTGWSDYVFRPGYRLRPLSEVHKFIQTHHHLPDIPSDAEVKE